MLYYYSKCVCAHHTRWIIAAQNYIIIPYCSRTYRGPYEYRMSRLASKTTRLYPCGKLIRQTTKRAPRDADIIIIIIITSDTTERVTSDTAAKFET